jgi:hypothetical protein
MTNLHDEHSMKKHVKSKDALAANIKAWALRAGWKGSSHELAKKLELPQKTMYNILHGAGNQFRSIDQLAHKMGVQPWELLYPVERDGLFEILRAYADTTEEGRRLVLLAAETAKRLSN